MYIDTSAYTAKRYPPALVEYLRAHGRRKVLFGSNYPMITPRSRKAFAWCGKSPYGDTG